MRKLTLALALLLTAVAVACSGQAPPTSPSAASSSTEAKPGAGANMAITTTINTSGDIVSDGGGAYTNGLQGVTSYLTANGYNGIANGDWQFNTSNSTRGVSKSLGTAVDPLTDPLHYLAPDPGLSLPFSGSQIFRDKIQVECTFIHKSMLTMAALSSMTCGLNNDFIMANGDTYGLAPMHSFNNFPETTDVQITCLSADSVGCNSWDIDPIPAGAAGGAPGGAVARLVRTPRRSAQLNYGDRYLLFHIHLTRP